MKKLSLIALLVFSISTFSQNVSNNISISPTSGLDLSKIDKTPRKTYSMSIKDVISTDNDYSIVLEVNKNKDDIWNSCNSWYLSNLDKYNASKILEDKSLGRIVFKVNQNVNLDIYAVEYNFIKLVYSFSIQIDCKDNKFRCLSTNRNIQIFPMRGSNLNSLDAGTLRAIKKQLELINNINSSYFNNTYLWQIDPIWNKLIEMPSEYPNFSPKDLLKNCLDAENSIVNNIVTSMNKVDNW